MPSQSDRVPLQRVQPMIAAFGVMAQVERDKGIRLAVDRYWAGGVKYGTWSYWGVCKSLKIFYFEYLENFL